MRIARKSYRFITKADGLGPNYLNVQNGARMLGCNVDLVRQIPRSELPVSQPAQRLIYHRSDVEALRSGVVQRCQQDNGGLVEPSGE